MEVKRYTLYKVRLDLPNRKDTVFLFTKNNWLKKNRKKIFSDFKDSKSNVLELKLFNILDIFLNFWRFEALHSYKLGSYKKKCGQIGFCSMISHLRKFKIPHIDLNVFYYSRVVLNPDTWSDISRVEMNDMSYRSSIDKYVQDHSSLITHPRSSGASS